MSAVNPCAIRIASVQPSGDAASSSSARWRVAAKREQQKIFQDRGTVLVVLDRDDLKDM
jgi:hypothetical protein